jgi:hypothetical protein
MTVFRTNTYIKLSDNMFTGSTWSKPWQARIVLITMLWLGQSTNGLVLVTISGLTRLCGIDREDVEKGLEILLSPDTKDPRTKAHEGRTIEEVEGGLANHQLPVLPRTDGP